MAISKNLHINGLIGFVMGILICCEGSAIGLQMDQLPVVSPTPHHCANSEHSTFIMMEVTNCTEQPCPMEVGGTYEVSPSFVPAFNTTGMSYYALFFYEGQNYGFSPIYYPDAFVAFKQHKLQREFVIPTNIRGQPGTFRMFLVDRTGVVHISRCFSATVGI
ncbi:uncharacterized protein LOC110860154 [Folsomia candida]|nr:uncharacterized protein LOC110860154 [Folsomia candida]